MTMTSLWLNVSVYIVANSNWSCLLISAPKVHRRVQPTAARRSGRFNKMHETQCALYVSLNNASVRTVRKCLKRDIDHLITHRIWLEWIVSGERRTKLFWNLHPKPKTVALEKIWDNFLQVQLIKLSRVLQIVWQEYVNGDWRHSKHLSLLKKCSHLSRFRRLEYTVETMFWKRLNC